MDRFVVSETQSVSEVLEWANSESMSGMFEIFVIYTTTYRRGATSDYQLREGYGLQRIHGEDQGRGASITFISTRE